MNNTLRYVIGVVAGVVIGVGLLFFLSDRGSVGGTTTYGGGLVVTDLKVGETYGITMDNVIPTSCVLSTTQLPLEASSSDTFYCAVSGVTSGDHVMVTIPGTGGTPYGGIFAVAAVASSTSGYIQVELQNLTGAATTSFSYATSAADVLIISP